MRAARPAALGDDAGRDQGRRPGPRSHRRRAGGSGRSGLLDRLPEPGHAGDPGRAGAAADRRGPAADRPAVAPHVRRHARLGTTRHRDLRRFRRRHRAVGPARKGVRSAGVRAARGRAPGADRLRGAEPQASRGSGGRLHAGRGTRLSRGQAARRAG